MSCTNSKSELFFASSCGGAALKLRLCDARPVAPKGDSGEFCCCAAAAADGELKEERLLVMLKPNEEKYPGLVPLALLALLLLAPSESAEDCWLGDAR